MKCRKFPILYALDSKGGTKVWEIKVTEVSAHKVLIEKTHGGLGEKLTTNTDIITEGKNLGKANETSPWEQAVSEAESDWTKKKEQKAYSEKKPSNGEADGKVVSVTDKPTLPMLALKYKERKKDIKWPAAVQPKLNGMRCTAKLGPDGKVIFTSRLGKPITTLQHLAIPVGDILRRFINGQVDGELFIPGYHLQDIIRLVKKERPETKQLQYWLYDVIPSDLNVTFKERSSWIDNYFDTPYTQTIPFSKFSVNPFVRIKNNLVLVPTIVAEDEVEMLSHHKNFVVFGFEGTIIRNLDSLYKPIHRSKDLQKYKDFEDEEFAIVGSKEATGDDRGTIVFICELSPGGKHFECRPEGSRATRAKWWNERESLVGKKLTVRYKELSKDGIPIGGISGISIRDYD